MLLSGTVASLILGMLIPGRVGRLDVRATIIKFRFALLPAVQLFCIATFFIGGAWFWSGFAVMLAAQLLFDAFGVEERGVDEAGPGSIESYMLHAVLPLHAVLTVLLIYHLSDWDFLGIGALSLFSRDLAAVRASSSAVDLTGAVICTGVLCAAVSGSVGHELMHRINSRFDLMCSRLILAFCGYTSLTIEHVYGHHRTVGTLEDPTTARRGTGFWSYVPRAIALTNRNAFRFEAARMRHKGRSTWGTGNRTLQGAAMSAALAGVFWAGAGGQGLTAFLVICLIGQVVIEQFNYIGHYGLVRVPGTPVMPRHSWNAFQLVSTSILFNLPRHSSHHSAPTKPYWALHPERDAPETPYGTTLMAIIALVPPLWFRVIGPGLEEWDATLASEEERALLANSGG